MHLYIAYKFCSPWNKILVPHLHVGISLESWDVKEGSISFFYPNFLSEKLYKNKIKKKKTVANLYIKANFVSHYLRECVVCSITCPTFY